MSNRSMRGNRYLSDEEIANFMKGLLILSANAAKKLNARGFGADVGVMVLAVLNAVRALFVKNL